MKKLLYISLSAIVLLFSCREQTNERQEEKDSCRHFLSEHYHHSVRKNVARDTIIDCSAEEALHAAEVVQNKDTMCGILRYVINHHANAESEAIVASALTKYYEESGKKTSMKRIKASVSADYAITGDTTLARRYLLASMKDTIPGNWQIVKDTDEKGKRVAQILLANGDDLNATQTYLANLQTCDSILITISRAQKEEVGRLRERFENALLYLGIMLLVAFGSWVVYVLVRRHTEYEADYENTVQKMRDEVEFYQTTIDRLEASNNDSTREIRMLQHLRDDKQERLMERLSKGKVIYDLVKAGKPMPVMMKDADALLIDYVLMMEPEHYDSLRSKYSSLSPRLFTYLILTDMGHSDTTIQTILSISPSSVRSLRSRLNARGKEK